MKTKIAVSGSLLAAMIVLSAPARAGVIFLTNNNPQPDEENILFNGPGSTPGPSLTVTGRTNQTSTVVAFTSDENLTTPPNGQADVVAVDGAFRLLSVYLQDGGTFGDLIFNLNTPNALTGTALITVDTTTGTSTYNFGVNNGQNFLTILASDATRINKVTIDSRTTNTDLKAIDIDDGRQFRISGLGATPVPEPGTLALFGLGLFAIQRLRQKYHK
jgi:hypothetical protein